MIIDERTDKQLTTLCDLKSLEFFLEGVDAMTNASNDLTKRYTIQFSAPANGKAMLHIVKDGEDWINVNVFTWEQLEGLRSMTKFGDNHRSQAITWTLLAAELSNLLDEQIMFSKGE